MEINDPGYSFAYLFLPEIMVTNFKTKNEHIFINKGE